MAVRSHTPGSNPNWVAFALHNPTNKVIDSRLGPDQAEIRRRRECLACNERFTTFEVAELVMPLVVKSDGTPVDLATLEVLRLGQIPADSARTRGRGLGLKIVRQVARLHELELSFAQGPDDTLEVRLSTEPLSH